MHYTTTRENWELRLTFCVVIQHLDYTTTRENWELRQAQLVNGTNMDYTTTRENWELRHSVELRILSSNYTTTRENWELRPYRKRMAAAAVGERLRGGFHGCHPLPCPQRRADREEGSLYRHRY